ncbi:hypothetical protein [Nitrospirillum sp. BR 11828]|nr:hypothetical protein [Nitrospirillum sp. BR 11828]MDZ5645994.1 hypothetical protein [Nitrospirillum sp. BR 11828]
MTSYPAARMVSAMNAIFALTVKTTVTTTAIGGRCGTGLSA